LPERCFDGGSTAKPQLMTHRAISSLHLDCTRTYIGKLEAEGVIHRLLALGNRL